MFSERGELARGGRDGMLPLWASQRPCLFHVPGLRDLGGAAKSGSLAKWEATQSNTYAHQHGNRFVCKLRMKAT